MENRQNSEFGSGNNPTGYLLPEFPEGTVPDPSPSFRTGRLALGAALFSTAVLAIEPAGTTADHSPESLALAPQVHHEHHWRETHHHRLGHIAAVTIHRETQKVAEHTPRKTVMAYAASVSSQTSTKRSGSHKATKVQPVPSYAITLPQAVEAQPVKDGQSNQWIEVDSAPYGYYLGAYDTATDKAIVLATTKQGDYHYLAIRMKRGSSIIEMCGWANNDAVTTGETNNQIKPAKNAAIYPDCMKQINRLSLFQFSFGHDYNSLNSADGAKTVQTAQCNGIEYRNDRALDAATTGASLRYIRRIKHPLIDVKAKIDSTAPLFSRYVPLDNKTLVARTDQADWGLFNRECATEIPKGGPPNHDRQRKKHQVHIH